VDDLDIHEPDADRRKEDQDAGAENPDTKMTVAQPGEYSLASPSA